MKKLLSCLVALALASGVGAAPAIPGKPEIVADAKFRVADERIPKPGGQVEVIPVNLPARWSTMYFRGEWDALQKSVIAALTNAGFKRPNGTPYPLDFEANLYSVVLLTSERKPDGELIRFLVGDSVTEPFANNLRGAEVFREIYVTTAAGSGMQSFVNTTPLPNPIEGQLQAFIKTLPLTAIADVIAPMSDLPNIEAANAQDAAALIAGNPPPPGTEHFAAVYELQLPSNLASIAIETFARSPEDLGRGLATKIDERKRSIALREARTSTCLTALNDALARAASMKANSVGFVDARLTATQRNAIADAVRSAYATFVNPAPAACTAADTEGMIALEKAYFDLVSAAASNVTTATFSHDNFPLRRWGVSMMGGVIVRAFDDQRAAVADGKLVRKELRAQQLISLNVMFHPVRFDATNSRLTAAERWKIFAGIVTTPDLGASVGVDFSIFKNFGIATGYALMRVEEATGAVPFDGEVGTADATHKSTAGAWFVGVSYKFP